LCLYTETYTSLCNILTVRIELINGIDSLKQWFPTCGMLTPGVRSGPLGVSENNIGTGGKHQKKELK
jgi:hypothetical protein